MKSSFSKRRNAWVCLLVAGLMLSSLFNGFIPAHAENAMLPVRSSILDDPDTSDLILNGFNFGFETVSNTEGLPDGWGRWGAPSYQIVLDSEVKHSGKYALRIESVTKDYAPNEFGCPRFSIPVDFTGKTVTVKAFMKLEGVERPIGLLLRVDGESGSLAFDNMQQRRIVGTHDWKEYSVTVDLPANAKMIHIGALHSGPGKLWVDDFQVIIGRKYDYNLGFEKVSKPEGLPDGWLNWGNDLYTIQIDSEVKHSGNFALRLEPKGEPDMQSIGCPARPIPAIFAGDSITLKAFMRTEGVERPIGLMLRIDGSNGVLQFDNMMQKGITGTDKWEEYSVTLPLPDEAKAIFIGAIFLGKGKLWVDDFQVLVDGVDISIAKPKPPKIFKAETDTEFDKGSTITIKQVTPQTVANLELLGKIWGFLKYYHPAVATGDYNWDAELFRILPSIIHAPNTGERNKLFVEWIDRLGKLAPNTQTTVVEAKLLPDLAWMDNSELGQALTQKLKEVKNAKREAQHYYIGLHPGVQNPDFKNEKPYPQMNYTDDSGMRLLALFRYWNMITYFFPYKHLTGKNWDTVLGEFIPKFLNGTTELDYKQSLLQLIAQVSDTHANIYSDRALDAWKGVNMAPYEVSFIEGKAVITGILNNEKVQPTELKKGDVITYINGKTVEQFVEERKPYSPASNPPVQLRNIARELLRTPNEAIALQIIREGKPQAIETACFPYVSLMSRNATPKPSHKMLSPDIGYIWPETLKNDSIAIIMEKFKDTKGLVIDFRCYPRADFTVFTLGGWLTPQPTDFVNFTRGSIEQPGTFVFTGALKVGNNNEQYYKGKVVIIVNETTQSSAEYHTMAFQTAPKAMVIGSTTAAADGNVSSILLPGNVSTMITGIGVYYPDGRETQRVGIALDKEVKPTIRGIIEGRDELLEKARELIN